MHCGQQHVLNDDILAKHIKVQFRCTKCGLITFVESKRRVDETMVISPMPSFARADASSNELQALADEENLPVPAHLSVLLTVVSGPEKGATFAVAHTRTIIGRIGADFALNDAEVSRHHCLLEVRDRFANLKDLESTNGTFFEEERVRAAMLQDGAEFRVGTSVIRVNIQPK